MHPCFVSQQKDIHCNSTHLKGITCDVDFDKMTTAKTNLNKIKRIQIEKDISVLYAKKNKEFKRLFK